MQTVFFPFPSSYIFNLFLRILRIFFTKAFPPCDLFFWGNEKCFPPTFHYLTVFIFKKAFLSIFNRKHIYAIQYFLFRNQHYLAKSRLQVLSMSLTTVLFVSQTFWGESSSLNMTVKFCFSVQMTLNFRKLRRWHRVDIFTEFFTCWSLNADYPKIGKAFLKMTFAFWKTIFLFLLPIGLGYEMLSKSNGLFFSLEITVVWANSRNDSVALLSTFWRKQKLKPKQICGNWQDFLTAAKMAIL